MKESSNLTVEALMLDCQDAVRPEVCVVQQDDEEFEELSGEGDFEDELNSEEDEEVTKVTQSTSKVDDNIMEEVIF